ncbi:MAG: hypothetical protein WC838_07050 [Candidatus Margulisiibacteriota bacterium]|jgi:predicted DNA binding CopG/RHH family protein
MKKIKVELDTYEKGIEAMANKLVPVSKRTKEKLDNIVARARKSKSISLRFNNYDLEKVKERAYQTGLPYQTMITMIVHQYLAGQFFSREEVVKTLALYRRK